MRGSVEFSTNVTVDDRDPVVLTNQDHFSHRGKPFRTEQWRAVGNTYGDDIGTWSWYRSGKILKNDGTPRADGAGATSYVKFDDVPGYVLRAVLKEIERRARAAHAEIDHWVQRARDQVTAVEAPA